MNDDLNNLRVDSASLWSSEIFQAALIFLVVFAWFAFHAVPSTYFGDNGELLAAIHSGGLPHPTGFPLFLLLNAFSVNAGTFAVNMTSSAAGALAVALLTCV